jgi:hypothetical protein
MEATAEACRDVIAIIKRYPDDEYFSEATLLARMKPLPEPIF